MTILVTGGAGFIGSAVVRRLINDGLLGQKGQRVVNVDALTYAGNLDSLPGVLDHPNHILVEADICDASPMEEIFATHQPDYVLHLAAESHVDRSIDGPMPFVQTNMVGTSVLLETALAYWQNLSAKGARDRAASFRFLHVSTDEVYGDLSADAPAFSEDHPYQPSSPYSASKASADHMVRAWHRTYGFPAVITNCSNNYGPYQFPEKLIPKTILSILNHQPIDVYGDGLQVRDWLFVDDHVQALLQVLVHGIVGETYNIGGDSERTNIDVVRTICAIVDRLHPAARGKSEDLIHFVKDRPGHDRRYAVDSRKIKAKLGWSSNQSFDAGLEKTVQWYLNNQTWCERVLDGSYLLNRLGEGSV